MLRTLITQTKLLYYIHIRIPGGHIHYIHLYTTNRIPDGHIILHTLITQTEYLMVIYYIHKNTWWSYYITYTYNTNRISDSHILHTLITQTEYLMVIHIIIYILLTQTKYLTYHTTYTEYLVVILYYIHL